MAQKRTTTAVAAGLALLASGAVAQIATLNEERKQTCLARAAFPLVPDVSEDRLSWDGELAKAIGKLSDRMDVLIRLEEKREDLADTC